MWVSSEVKERYSHSLFVGEEFNWPFMNNFKIRDVFVFIPNSSEEIVECFDNLEMESNVLPNL